MPETDVNAVRLENLVRDRYGIKLRRTYTHGGVVNVPKYDLLIKK